MIHPLFLKKFCRLCFAAVWVCSGRWIALYALSLYLFLFLYNNTLKSHLEETAKLTAAAAERKEK